MEDFTQLLLEMLILGLLALGYFYYQKSRIIKNSTWSENDWHMLYHLTLEFEDFEKFSDYAHFLEALEKVITSQIYPDAHWFTPWRSAQLPPSIIELFPKKHEES